MSDLIAALKLIEPKDIDRLFDFIGFLSLFTAVCLVFALLIKSEQIKKLKSKKKIIRAFDNIPRIFWVAEHILVLLHHQSRDAILPLIR